jgi:hypothetical protein
LSWASGRLTANAHCVSCMHRLAHGKQTGLGQRPSRHG